MKFGFRMPSLKKRIAARTSWKRAVRHRAGLKAPRGMGWLTNPKRAAYNRVYNRTTFGLGRGGKGGQAVGGCLIVGVLAIGAAVSFAAAHIQVLVIAAVVGVGIVGIAAIALAARDASLRAQQAEPEEQRRQGLVARFAEEIAAKIVAGQVWEGATHEMVVEALGPPVEVKERVLKTKIKTTLCYDPISSNRYRFKVELDDGVVVKWTAPRKT
ncbi:MAG: hypothetical protein IPM35_41295 [Myxococcales bacterium]|nr:hypothetical protein [Myxococcales bacterium]